MGIRKLILTTTLFVLATVSVAFANVQGANEREDEQSQDEKKGRLVEARYYSKSGREEGEQTDKKLFMIISYEYDAKGNLVSGEGKRMNVENPGFSADGKEYGTTYFTYEYDAAGNLIKVEEECTTLGPAGWGHWDEVVEGTSGHTAIMEYDADGRLKRVRGVKETDPKTGIFLEYDEKGHVKRVRISSKDDSGAGGYLGYTCEYMMDGAGNYFLKDDRCETTLDGQGRVTALQYIAYPEYPEYSPDTWTFAYDESNRMKTASMYELYSTDTYSKTWEAGYAFKYDMYGNCTGVTTTRRNTEKFANSELDSAPYFSYEEWEYIYDYSYTAPAKFSLKNYHPRTMGYSWFPKDITVFGGADPWA